MSPAPKFTVFSDGSVILDATQGFDSLAPGARVSTDYAVANFFHFTVDTDTATIGGVKGGGVGCSVGPVTLSA